VKRVLALTLAIGATAGIALAQAPKTTEITFWSWWLSPTFDGFLKDRIAAFEKANPTIKVKWFDKQGTIVEDFIAAVNLGQAPDVVNLNIDETTKAAQNNFIQPIDKYTPAAVLNAVFYPNSVSNYTVNGKPYGYPWYGWLNEGALIYNSELFRKAGLTRAPRTMNELMDFAKIIKDKTGAYGWVPAYKDPNTASFLGYFYSEGLAIYDKAGKAAFNTAAHAALLQKYAEYYKGAYAPQESLRREAFQVATELYAQGKLAMIIGGPQALTRIQENNKDLYGKTTVVAAPLGSAKRQTGGGMDLVIPSASKHPKEAAKFAEFITNNANQMAFAKVVAIVPQTRGAQFDAYFKEQSADPIAKAKALTGANGRFIDPGYNPPKGNSDDLYKNFNDNVEAAVLGQKTPQQALNDAVAYWNANMK
jgi:putative chitobiose transport system substrate-binding protein